MLSPGYPGNTTVAMAVIDVVSLRGYEIRDPDLILKRNIISFCCFLFVFFLDCVLSCISLTETICLASASLNEDMFFLPTVSLFLSL